MSSTWFSDKTIAAIATPSGAGGIGIVKISGGDAISIAQKIFKERRSGKIFGKTAPWQTITETTPSHRLFYGDIVDPADNVAIDEVLISFMLAPHSYTREDVVEINAHSGRLVLRRILELVIRHGAKIAEPGEFTKRAYINGRIDLTQAESVADIINAKSDMALQWANGQLKGAMRDRIQSLRERLLSLYAEIEAKIDFPEDIDIEEGFEKKIEKDLDALKKQIRELVSAYDNGHMIRDGFRISIVGKPNVGKSSLMNRLLEKDRVIVTAMPGTTRDIIEENIMLEGFPVSISDTAGLRGSDDPVEQLGVDRTKHHIAETDLILFMLEAGSPLTEEDHAVYSQIKDKKKIIVLNKIDLLLPASRDNIIPDTWEPRDLVKISALFNKGIDLVKKEIVSLCQETCFIKSQNGIVPNLRQAVALKEGLDIIKNAQEGLRKKIPIDILSEDIKATVECLNEITGQNIKDEVLDKIFKTFCIGK